MIKIFYIGKIKYVCKYVGSIYLSGGKYTPCFLGMKGYVLCGILNFEESLDEFKVRIKDIEKKCNKNYGRKIQS